MAPVNTVWSASKAAVTVTVWSVAPSSTAVWSPSSVPSVSTLKVMVSLSLMVIIAELTVNPLTAPVMSKVSEPSTIASSTRVNVNLADPEDFKAGMTTLKEGTAK